MEEEDLKWYSTFIFLFGTIISFADPITDIATLVEFYRQDHKTWFGVGLAFVILPCLLFLITYIGSKQTELEDASRTRRYVTVFLCGFNPFSSALARLRLLIFCIKNFKKLWRCEKIESTENADELLLHSETAGFIEAVTESAPQFIIQLYAMSVQEEPLKIIQIISLPISFLSLAWASTVADELIQGKGVMHTNFPNMKHKILLFVTNLFFLSSRLFAIGFFTVSYKWWILSVLMTHSVVIAIADTVGIFRQGDCDTLIGFLSAVFCCLHWLRDDMTIEIPQSGEERRGENLRAKRFFSNVLFVIENFIMILLFYFSPFSNTWYSLPVTVCVCLFSVLGAVMRVALFLFLTKEVKMTANAQRFIRPSEDLEDFSIYLRTINQANQAPSVSDPTTSV